MVKLRLSSAGSQNQSTIFKPGTRRNSLVLWVTRVAPWASAVPAMRVSIGPALRSFVWHIGGVALADLVGARELRPSARQFCHRFRPLCAHPQPNGVGDPTALGNTRRLGRRFKRGGNLVLKINRDLGHDLIRREPWSPPFTQPLLRPFWRFQEGLEFEDRGTAPGHYIPPHAAQAGTNRVQS
jgi:hypothetical protein